MTDQNTAMMREVFKWLSKYETVPATYDEKWWTGFTSEAAEIYNRYPQSITRHLLMGIMSAQEEEYRLGMISQMERDREQGRQMAIDTTYKGEYHAS